MFGLLPFFSIFRPTPLVFFKLIHIYEFLGFKPINFWREHEFFGNLGEKRDLKPKPEVKKEKLLSFFWVYASNLKFEIETPFHLFLDLNQTSAKKHILKNNPQMVASRSLFHQDCRKPHFLLSSLWVWNP